MDRIGKYVIHKVSVTSGYAQVVFCSDPDLQVPVAIKLFDPRRVNESPLSPAQWLGRFVFEARGLAMVDHTYVTPVKSLEQLPDGRPYFVMPYFAAHLAFEIGHDSPSELDGPKRLSLARSILLLRQLSAALASMHRKGMVHRWVKPSNILLTAK
jgi:serine/threonine-protein kinase